MARTSSNLGRRPVLAVNASTTIAAAPATKEAETSEKLYRRFKADEPSQALVGGATQIPSSRVRASPTPSLTRAFPS